MLGAVAVVWATVAGADASTGQPATRITAALPRSGTVGTSVTVRGRVSRAPADSTAKLERSGTAGRWTVLATSPVRNGRFAVSWRPRTSGLLTVRLALARRGRTIATTRTSTILVGSAPVYCAAPSAPAGLAPGDGYVVGGVYNVGGPAPGITVCHGQAEQVTVTGATGVVVAAEDVAGGQSYTFELPPGLYELDAGACRGSATVHAGAETHADTICDVP